MASPTTGTPGGNRSRRWPEHFQVVAIDQRGYNKSDQPEGVANYGLPILAQDVRNVVQHLGRDKAVLVGHDWGGYVAWTCAMMFPTWSID